MNFEAFSETFSIVLAVVVCVLVSFVVGFLSRSRPEFLGYAYWKWVAVSAALCAIVPVLYFAGDSHDISIVGAYSIGVWYVGAGKVLLCYSVFAGLLIGGLIGAMTKNAARSIRGRSELTTRTGTALSD